MGDIQLSPSERRKNEALEIFRQFPGKIAPSIQEKILKQEVVIGMTPYDSYLAGGAFSYKVIADPAVWKGNVDPYQVMWAQSVKPDASQIWMTFENDTQFPNKKGKIFFQVHFSNGLAQEITILD